MAAAWKSIADLERTISVAAVGPLVQRSVEQYAELALPLFVMA